MIALSPFARRILASAASLLLILTLGPSHASADPDQLRPTWQCLPEEAVVAFRIPNGQAAADAFLENTKLGTVLFAGDRIAAVTALIEEKQPEAWSKLQEKLTEYGLTLDDCTKLLAGESGYAVLVSFADEAEEEPPFAAGLAWFQPGSALATRVYEAVGQAVGHLEDDEDPIRRVDIDLQQCQVMQLTVPVVNLEYDTNWELPDDFSELSDEQRSQFWENLQKAREAGAVKKLTYRTVLVGKMGDRLLVAHTHRDVSADDEPAQAEQLTTLLARVVAAHSGAPTDFVARFAQTPGAAEVFELEGVGVIEVVADLPPLLKLARATARDPEEPEQAFRMLGLGQLGTFSLRSTLLGSESHSRYFLAAPAPRPGMLALLDQEPLSTQPPSWVPASVIRFSQWSFDLASAYATIKQAVIKEYPEEAEPRFQQTEAQILAVTQASLEDLLASVGHRHVMLRFEPVLKSQAVPALGRPMDDADDADAEEVTVVVERMAIVTQVSDEELWSRVLQSLAPFAGMAPGIEFKEEQGFRGWRLDRESFEGGLFLGNGYLVFARGPDVLSTVLSSLNNPPEGSAALEGSELYAEAASIAELGPCVVFDLTDGNRTAKVLVAAFKQSLEQFDRIIEMVDNDEQMAAQKLWLAVFRTLLPTEEEVEGTLGVMVTTWEVNEDGLMGRAVQQLPPAD